VLHNTKIPLTVWFWAAYLMTTDKRGISALLLQRQMGLRRYETAWMLLHKLRRAMVNATREPLHGDVEIDDTWVGGPQAGLRGSRQLTGRKAAIVVVAAVSGVALVARGDAAPGTNRIAVLPIQDISGADGQFVDAMHDQLIIAVGQTGGLTVAPRSATMIYRSQPKPMMDVARELHVGAILEATVFRTGDRMRINVQLTEPRTVRQIWSHSYEINVSDVLGAQDSVVRQIAAGIRQAVLPSASPSSP